METVKNWTDLSWQEKREERFKQWLSPTDVKFASPEAENLYKARVTRFIKAIKMEEPDRVPVILPSGYLPAWHYGVTFRDVMYDFDLLRKAWIKFMEDFGDMDTFSGPILIPSGRISEAIDSKVTQFPGHGLPMDSAMTQIIEAEYMFADEYDKLLTDISDFSIRVMLPRTTHLFEPLANLPPLRSLQGAAWVAVLADPEIRRVFQTLMELADEYKQHQVAIAEVSRIALERGYPSFRGAGPRGGAPFDHFADLLRGTRGISTDMYRQPQKLHEAMEFWLSLTIETSIKNFPMTNCPVCMMPLHKGDDTFMSDKQFEEFYWPYLRQICMAMINEGLVPMPFAEGRYTHRLKQIADTPRSGVVWYFDQTDMAEAKRILGDVCCIVGNVPTGIVMTGTPEEVKENCRRLIKTCAPGGGYILAGGATVSKGDIRNLKAMMESAYEYGVY